MHHGKSHAEDDDDIVQEGHRDRGHEEEMLSCTMCIALIPGCLLDVVA